MAYTQTTRMVSGVTNTGSAEMPLLLTEGEMKLMAENPEQVMEEIRVRAEQVSSVLQDILHEPHGVPRWGINE
jgi:hypothetical protein